MTQMIHSRHGSGENPAQPAGIQSTENCLFDVSS